MFIFAVFNNERIPGKPLGKIFSYSEEENECNRCISKLQLQSPENAMETNKTMEGNLNDTSCKVFATELYRTGWISRTPSILEILQKLLNLQQKINWEIFIRN